MEKLSKISIKDILSEAKKKGADGKACWKGYRYAGTEDGKDKCVKVDEKIIYQNESLKLEIVEHSEPVIFQEAEYQGRKVELNKVKRGGDSGKFYVYTKNPKGNVVKVQFGAKGMAIKTKDPDRRRSFRARMGCDKSPGPKHKANYWSCRMWSGPDAVKNMLKK
jgi:hypothetical protein